jgi:hypothetical protein
VTEPPNTEARANAAFISRAVRENGYCGEVSADGEHVCVKDADHDGPHGDERWDAAEPPNTEAALTTVREHVRFHTFARTQLECEKALAALDTIASELEQAREDYEAQREYADEQYRKALAAEAELERREQLFNAFRDADERTITEQRVELERLRLSMDARQQEVDEFRFVHGVMTQDWKNAVRARDDWADRAEAAEAELETVRAERDETEMRRNVDLSELRDELRRVRAERDEWKHKEERERSFSMRQARKMGNVEARLDRAVEALREIAYLPQDYPPDELLPQVRAARAALAEIEESLTRNEWETIHENLKCKDS